jgi:hypothetical protein
MYVCMYVCMYVFICAGSNWLSRVLERCSGPNLKGRAMKVFRVIVAWLAVQDLTSVDVVIQQEIVRSSSGVFMFVHCLFDLPDAMFRLWILNVCMGSTCSQSNIISAAPRCQRFAHESVVCTDEFELNTTRCLIFLNTRQKSRTQRGVCGKSKPNAAMIINKEKCVCRAINFLSRVGAQIVNVETFTIADVRTTRNRGMNRKHMTGG